jgi:hypothetical protein
MLPTRRNCCVLTAIPSIKPQKSRQWHFCASANRYCVRIADSNIVLSDFHNFDTLYESSLFSSPTQENMTAAVVWLNGPCLDVVGLGQVCQRPSSPDG